MKQNGYPIPIEGACVYLRLTLAGADRLACIEHAGPHKCIGVNDGRPRKYIGVNDAARFASEGAGHGGRDSWPGGIPQYLPSKNGGLRSSRL